MITLDKNLPILTYRNKDLVHAVIAMGLSTDTKNFIISSSNIQRWRRFEVGPSLPPGIGFKCPVYQSDVSLTTDETSPTLARDFISAVRSLSCGFCVHSAPGG